jgi:NAD(P)-dependent dehydrogenase (short-subunit alcohol dehydrogenase family)
LSLVGQAGLVLLPRNASCGRSIRLHHRSAREGVGFSGQEHKGKRHRGARRCFSTGDVSQIGDLERLFAQIKQEKGRLDIVFANAGIAKYAPLGEITEEFFDSIFDVNAKGLLFTVQKALPLLKDGASIVLCASVVASKGLPSNSVYSATKAAVRSFARTWATDLRSRRIRVNAVSPGSTDTPGLSELLGSSETGQQRLKMISNIVPLGRLGAPDEVARAVVFLASDDASYVTGAELFVDGGFAQV